MPPKRKSVVKRKPSQRGGAQSVGFRSTLAMRPIGPTGNAYATIDHLAPRQTGSGFFDDVWSGIKSVGSFVKDNKLISTGLGLIGDPRAQAGSRIAGQLGFGKKKKRKTVRK